MRHDISILVFSSLGLMMIGCAENAISTSETGSTVEENVSLPATSQSAAQTNQDELQNLQIKKYNWRWITNHTGWEVKSVDVGGTIEVEWLAPAERKLPLYPEGYFVGIVRPAYEEDKLSQEAIDSFDFERADSFPLKASELEEIRIVRCRILEVKENAAFTLQVRESAVSHVSKGDVISFWRWSGSTTKEMEELPDIWKLVLGPPNNSIVEYKKKLQQEPDILTSSKILNDVRNIGLALHNYNASNDRLPPAVVYGPDGKPWHSWRVLLLPYLDNITLYRKYRFDEPWDGPNNRKLIDQIPIYYQYPGDDSHFTRYVVPVAKSGSVGGFSTMFPEKGITIAENATDDDIFEAIAQQKDGTRRLEDFLDGLNSRIDANSYTLLLGMSRHDERVPWSKPQDLNFSEQQRGLSQKGSFDASLTINGKKCGVFVLADGLAHIYPQSLSQETFVKMLAFDDNDDLAELPEVKRPEPPDTRKTNVLQIDLSSAEESGTAIVLEVPSEEK